MCDFCKCYNQYHRDQVPSVYSLILYQEFPLYHSIELSMLNSHHRQQKSLPILKIGFPSSSITYLILKL
jgi:hypothetical protein